MGLKDYDFPENDIEDDFLDNLSAGERNKILAREKYGDKGWTFLQWFFWFTGLTLAFIWCAPWAIITIVLAITVLLIPLAFVAGAIGAFPAVWLLALHAQKANRCYDPPEGVTVALVSIEEACPNQPLEKR